MNKNWTESDLKQQLERAESKRWIQYFEAAATLHNFPVELLLAIASRETNMRNIKGDFDAHGKAHGYGILQVDILTDPVFCSNWTEEDVERSIQRGTEILAGKRDSLATHQITDLKAIAAAYNTGQGNVMRSVRAGHDVDSTTTGGNYGRDVLERMQVFMQLRSKTIAAGV